MSDAEQTVAAPRRGGCLRVVLVAIVVVAVVVAAAWAARSWLIPLVDPIAEPREARRIFRTIRVASAWRFLRTAMSGELGTERFAEPRSDFHRDHTLAQVCEAATRWNDARVTRARGLLQDVLSGSRPEAEELVTAAHALLDEGHADEARLLLARRVEGYLAGGGDASKAVPDEVLLVSGELELLERVRAACEAPGAADQCLYPPRSATSGSSPAAPATSGALAALAARHPDDPAARWRAAIEAAFAGPAAPDVSAPAPRWNPRPPPLLPFPESSAAAGLRQPRAAGGVVLDDFDEDGDLDVLLTSHLPCDPVLYLRNRGDGTFEDATAGSGLEGQLGGFDAAQADVNRDGHLDVLIARSGWGGAGRNSLVLGDGHGHFEDATHRAGLDAANDATTAAAFADYDGDGWVDLFVTTFDLTRMPGSRSRLYRNRGDGSFEETTFVAGLPAIRFATGSAWGDYDDDGRPDLYISTMGGPNLLFRNHGDGHFEDVTVKAGCLAPLTGFATRFFDFDNDGHLDLWAGAYWPVLGDGVASLVDGEDPDPATTGRLYRNRGDGTFEDRTRAAGLDAVMSAMGANFGDLDGDGWLDIYIATGSPSLSHLVPNRLFRNVRGERFEDATVAARVGHLQKGHGVAFGDLDGDRNLDLLVNLGGTVPAERHGPALFHNPLPGHHVTEVELRGTRSNTAAIGARLTAWLTDGRRVERVVGSGGSFGASPLRQSLGLGSAAGIERLEVRWPSGARETVRDLAAGARYRIVEGEGRASEVAPPR